MGAIEVRGKHIDWINITGVSTQYGTNYFLDFQVDTPNLAIKKPKKTVLRKKKASRKAESYAIYCSGDESFAMTLSLDSRLEKLLSRSEFKGAIEIIPELKHGCTRIKMVYLLPEPELFEAIDIVAGHIKSDF